MTINSLNILAAFLAGVSFGMCFVAFLIWQREKSSESTDKTP